MNLDQLKQYMSLANTVEEWNTLREEAKNACDTQVIRDLDSSGYINKVLHQD